MTQEDDVRRYMAEHDVGRAAALPLVKAAQAEAEKAAWDESIRRAVADAPPPSAALIERVAVLMGLKPQSPPGERP